MTTDVPRRSKTELVIAAMEELRKLDPVRNEWVRPATVEHYIVSNLGDTIGDCQTTMADMTKPEFSPRNFSSGVKTERRILEREGHLYRLPIVSDSTVSSAGGSNGTNTALFMNGVHRGVLDTIIKAHEDNPNVGNFLLQPYKGKIIRMLQDRAPSPEASIRLYMSTTENLSNICYTAEIIGWEDKREISDRRRREIGSHLQTYQPGEVSLFAGTAKAGGDAVNLISIRDLRRLDSLYSTSLLKKRSDDQPLKSRTRSGGWSEVYDIGDLLFLPTETRDSADADLAASLESAQRLSDVELQERLQAAPKLPERIQIISEGYRRNADVIVAVLRRANGVCEKCQKEAPFKRRSDGSPFLEVHHSIPLSQGGEDTVENAVGLCPNCHRKAHHG